jgi:hypothetical protein
MQNETQWQTDRANLRRLHAERPDWSKSQLAQALSRSPSWVKKWLKRFKLAAAEPHPDPDPKKVLYSRASVRKNPLPPTPPHPLIVERIVAIRNQPPQGLHRTPGPKTILYYLQTDPVLLEHQLKPPTSTSFIWKILDQQHCISRPTPPKDHQPLPRPAPLSQFQIDFKDITTVTLDPDGKQAHLVEVLNVVDEGTSMLVEAVAREDFNAETALLSLVEVVQQHGLPEQITFDRDPRFVGSHTGRDFPSAFIKFWHCLGVRVNVCPPHRPDLNCYVERYHRSYGSECLAFFRPENLARVREVTAQYKQHYNYERPHQGTACHNQPPRVAFPELPALPSVPLVVDPDKWVERCATLRFSRKVDYRGVIKVDKHHYYLKKELAGQYVMVEIEAVKRELVVSQGKASGSEEIRRMPIKGLVGGVVSFEEYVKLMLTEARSERRLAALRARAARGIIPSA